MPHSERVTDLDFRRHADDLRQSWQGRMLAMTYGKPISGVVLSILSHNFDDAMPVLLRVVFPGFVSIKAPFICSAAKVSKAGHVVADIVDRHENHIRGAVVFRSLKEMETAIRRLADKMKLSDEERVEFFMAAKRWVVADQRLDPAMNPADPDAKRFTVH